MTSVASISRRFLSPTLFAAVLLAFALPFATVSCDDASTTFSGVQLVTRSVPAGGSVGDEDIADSVEDEASFAAEIEFAAAVIGLLLGLFGVNRGPGWCVALGLLATIYLAWKGFTIFGPSVHHRSGFWLTAAGFLWLAVVHAYRAWRRGAESEPWAPAPDDGLPRAGPPLA